MRIQAIIPDGNLSKEAFETFEIPIIKKKRDQVYGRCHIPTACHTAVPIIIYGYPCIPPYPYSDRRTYRYRRISMSGHMAIHISGGIIAFPIRVCHGLDSDILDKFLT